jgi:double zinc ribbon protein
MALCPSCRSELSASSKFCTACGKPAVAAPPEAQSSAFCTSCGSKLSGNTRFCTACGAPAGTIAAAAKTEPPAPPIPQSSPAPVASPEPAVAPQQSASASSASPIPVPAPQSEPAPAAPQPQTAAAASARTFAPEQTVGAYAAQPAYDATQEPRSGKFRSLVLVLLLVIVLGGLGAWYFWGVETVIVCSPPDVRVFVDGREITTNSPGRYVISHLSRKPHLLKVQGPGFADTIQRLDFPLSSLNEWVNITLTPSRHR